MSDPTSDPSEDSEKEPQAGSWLARVGVTRQRLVVWSLGAGVAIYLIVTGIVGILTKAR